MFSLGGKKVGQSAWTPSSSLSEASREAGPNPFKDGETVQQRGGLTSQEASVFRISALAFPLIRMSNTTFVGGEGNKSQGLHFRMIICSNTEIGCNFFFFICPCFYQKTCEGFSFVLLENWNLWLEPVYTLIWIDISIPIAMQVFFAVSDHQKGFWWLIFGAFSHKGTCQIIFSWRWETLK